MSSKNRKGQPLPVQNVPAEQQIVPEIPKPDPARVFSGQILTDKQQQIQDFVAGAYARGFQGEWSHITEIVGYPGGSYTLETLKFFATNGRQESYDLALALAYPQITYTEMVAARIIG